MGHFFIAPMLHIHFSTKKKKQSKTRISALFQGCTTRNPKLMCLSLLSSKRIQMISKQAKLQNSSLVPSTPKQSNRKCFASYTVDDAAAHNLKKLTPNSKEMQPALKAKDIYSPPSNYNSTKYTHMAIGSCAETNINTCSL